LSFIRVIRVIRGDSGGRLMEKNHRNPSRVLVQLQQERTHRKGTHSSSPARTAA
jgi:hypothetical protein